MIPIIPLPLHNRSQKGGPKGGPKGVIMGDTPNVTIDLQNGSPYVPYYAHAGRYIGGGRGATSGWRHLDPGGQVPQPLIEHLIPQNGTPLGTIQETAEEVLHHITKNVWQPEERECHQCSGLVICNE